MRTTGKGPRGGSAKGGRNRPTGPARDRAKGGRGTGPRPSRPRAPVEREPAEEVVRPKRNTRPVDEPASQRRARGAEPLEAAPHRAHAPPQRGAGRASRRDRRTGPSAAPGPRVPASPTAWSGTRRAQRWNTCSVRPSWFKPCRRSPAPRRRQIRAYGEQVKSLRGAGQHRAGHRDRRPDRAGDAGRARHAGGSLSGSPVPHIVVQAHPARRPQGRIAGEREAGGNEGSARGRPERSHSAA